jgi:hypothetical protein
MKTLEEIMRGVTEPETWKQSNYRPMRLISRDDPRSCYEVGDDKFPTLFEAPCSNNPNSDLANIAFAARAARNFEPLVKALEEMMRLWDDNHPEDRCSCLGKSEDCPFPPPCELCIAREALAQALADEP